MLHIDNKSQCKNKAGGVMKTVAWSNDGNTRVFTFTNIHKKYYIVIVHCGTQTRLVESTGACKNGNCNTRTVLLPSVY